MSASGVPIMKYLAAQGTIDFGQAVSYVWVRNSGTDSAFMAEGATPPTPSAGDGREIGRASCRERVSDYV